jgi:hypothetical protein
MTDEWARSPQAFGVNGRFSSVAAAIRAKKIHGHLHYSNVELCRISLFGRFTAQ